MSFLVLVYQTSKTPEKALAFDDESCEIFKSLHFFVLEGYFQDKIVQ